MTQHKHNRTDALVHDDVRQELPWETRVDKTEMKVDQGPGMRAAVNGFRSCGPVFVCFPEQNGAGTTDDTETAEGVLRGGRSTLCGGPECRAESVQVDGWLFVGRGGERRHYCWACLVSYLDGLRGPSAAD